MAIVSVGYGNDQVDEQQWALINAANGSPYGYSGPNALRAYAGSGTREVALTDGWTLGWGVKASVTGEKVTLPSAASGTVTYMVVLRRRWGSGQRTTTVEYLQMSGTSPVGRLQRPGVEDDQPICLATVTAGSGTVTAITDLRVHSAKAHYAPSIQAAQYSMQLGARYVLPNGDRYVATIGGGSVLVLEKEKDPPAPVIPSVPVVRAGTVGLAFDSSGQATFAHNLGWTPSVFLPCARMNPASAQVDVSVSFATGAVSSQYVTLVAKIQSPDPPGWKPYVGNLTYVDWIAYGGVQ